MGSLTHVERVSDARKKLEESRFDIALRDLSLPDSQGLETIAGRRSPFRFRRLRRCKPIGRTYLTEPGKASMS